MYGEREARRQVVEIDRYAPRAQAKDPQPVLAPLLPLLALVLVGLAFILNIR